MGRECSHAVSCDLRVEKMIYGIGTDMVSIARIAEAYARHGERFVARLLAVGEKEAFAAAAEPARFLAKRWAAKEAFAKALGTGIRPPVSFQAVTVTRNPLGRPGITVDAAVAALLSQYGVTHMHLSISDEVDMALAFVVLETG